MFQRKSHSKITMNRRSCSRAQLPHAHAAGTHFRLRHPSVHTSRLYCRGECDENGNLIEFSRDGKFVTIDSLHGGGCRQIT